MGCFSSAGQSDHKPGHRAGKGNTEILSQHIAPILTDTLDGENVIWPTANILVWSCLVNENLTLILSEFSLSVNILSYSWTTRSLTKTFCHIFH